MRRMTCFTVAGALAAGALGRERGLGAGQGRDPGDEADDRHLLR